MKRILSLHSLHDDLEQFHDGSLLIHDQFNVALPVYRLPTGFSLRVDVVELFHLCCVDDVLRGF